MKFRVPRGNITQISVELTNSFAIYAGYCIDIAGLDPTGAIIPDSQGRGLNPPVVQVDGKGK